MSKETVDTATQMQQLANEAHSVEIFQQSFNKFDQDFIEQQQAAGTGIKYSQHQVFSQNLSSEVKLRNTHTDFLNTRNQWPLQNEQYVPQTKDPYILLKAQVESRIGVTRTLSNYPKPTVRVQDKDPSKFQQLTHWNLIYQDEALYKKVSQLKHFKEICKHIEAFGGFDDTLGAILPSLEQHEIQQLRERRENPPKFAAPVYSTAEQIGIQNEYVLQHKDCFLRQGSYNLTRPE